MGKPPVGSPAHSTGQSLAGLESESACFRPRGGTPEARTRQVFGRFPRQRVPYPCNPFTRQNSCITIKDMPVLYAVGEPVCRVSDEEVFWASMAVRPRAARQPVRAKNRRSRGSKETRKTPNVLANKGQIGNRTLPLVWRGMWRG